MALSCDILWMMWLRDYMVVLLCGDVMIDGGMMLKSGDDNVW